jgi:hypothetical protein
MDNMSFGLTKRAQMKREVKSADKKKKKTAYRRANKQQ